MFSMLTHTWGVPATQDEALQSMTCYETWMLPALTALS